MRILADENVAGPLIAQLRAQGHDVASVKENMRQANDRVVLARAREDGRILVTSDKDFGELAVRQGLAGPYGVILLRLGGRNTKVDDARALEAIVSRESWTGLFVVVEDDRIRTRPLPTERGGGTS